MKANYPPLFLLVHQITQNRIRVIKTVLINGDGETSWDFCYIDNTVQMNILAAVAKEDA